MVRCVQENGKFGIVIKLTGPKGTKEEIFYLDTGFDGHLKIDKKLFDDLGLEKKGNQSVSFANNRSEGADISTVKFEVDQASGESPVMAVGWGGRSLIGMRFFEDANILLVMDGSKGAYITNNRLVAYKVGELLHHIHKT